MEVRTEEERTPNHDGGKHTEPNETTPLTEPEYVGGEGLSLISRAPHPPPPPTHTAHASHPSLPATQGRPDSGALGQKSLAPSLPREKAFWVLLRYHRWSERAPGMSGISRPCSRVTHILETAEGGRTSLRGAEKQQILFRICKNSRGFCVLPRRVRKGGAVKLPSPPVLRSLGDPPSETSPS